MRASHTALAGRQSAAVNARAKRRLDGKPRLAASPVFACMGRAGEVVLGCRCEEQQHTRTTNQFVNAWRAYRTRQVKTCLENLAIVPVWDCASSNSAQLQNSVVSAQNV
jgi:hypothetical protein